MSMTNESFIPDPVVETNDGDLGGESEWWLGVLGVPALER
jgi:hypothetical protein